MKTFTTSRIKRFSGKRLLYAGLASLLASSAYATTGNPVVLEVVKQPLVVNGKTVQVFNIVQPDGQWGYVGHQGQWFDVKLENQINEPTTIHWHGLIPPNNEDGVPYVTQLPIPAHQSQIYRFKLTQSGTFFMHSHYKTQEESLMAAPLIILPQHPRYPKAHNITLMLQDFTFASPAEVLKRLENPSPQPTKTPEKPTLNDVQFDAFLANRHTLQNPEVIKVKPGELVRLRVINAASGTEFFLRLGKLNKNGNAIAVDGNPIKPYHAGDYQIGIAQRMDFLLRIPKRQGAYPVLAQGSGTMMQTGIILATAKAAVPQLSEYTRTRAGAFTYEQTMAMKPLHPLKPHIINQTLRFVLNGSMRPYRWTINGQVWPHITPNFITKGERVKMVLINKSGMAHPMHLHGHVFEITSINGHPIQGPMRDTVMVLPHSTVKVQFNADDPGIWAFHCHLIFHQETGMMTTINYRNYTPPAFYLKEIGMSYQQYEKLAHQSHKD